MSGATKAKAPVERGLSQTNKSERTPTVPNVRADDGAVNDDGCTVKQFLLIRPEALKVTGPSTRLVSNTDGGHLLGYRRLCGYGAHFKTWASADGSAVAWCGPSLGFRTRIRQRLCLAGLVAQLRAGAGQ